MEVRGGGMRHGLPLLFFLLMLWLLIALGRWGFFAEETPAAFVPLPPRAGVPVWLGDGFVETGLHQFSDGETPLSAIKLTHAVVDTDQPAATLWRRPLLPGERLDLLPGGGLRRSLLPAQQRLLLHIRLHPDRMSRSDWEALPGIGPKLAAAIMADRQNNGDFGSLEGLLRVKGVGPGRLRQWREMFEEGK